MMTLQRPAGSNTPVLKILGLGGAGGATIDRLLADGVEGASVIAMNTDVQALNACAASHKVQLGRNVTRGLGAGGDPEIGYEAAEEAADDIRAIVEGADVIFLCAGLGGGTGSGAAPLIAHMARNGGALVVAFATLPFQFEGRRRRTQADQALAQLEEQADLVVCFENDRMSDAVAPAGGVRQAFIATDQMLSQAIRSVTTLVRRGGVMDLGLDELAAALRGQHPRCLFGHGESEGAHRAHEALARALNSPLMGRGAQLALAPSVLVHIAGGPELALAEIAALMDELNGHIGDNTRIDLGIATDAKLGRKLSVTIISSTGEASPASSARPVSTRTPAHTGEEHYPAPDEEEALVHAPRAEAGQAVTRGVPVAQPAATDATRGKAAAKAAAKKEEKAEQMQLEPANRGRFEKSEPTMRDGHDLDVPTFLRKNAKGLQR